MTPGEKLYNIIKNGLIEKYGDDFLELSEKDQNNLILDKLREYVDSIKTHR